MTSSVSAIGSLPTIIKTISADSADRAATEELLLAWSSYDWRRLLLDLPVDAKSFAGRYERSWDGVIVDLRQWCNHFLDRSSDDQERLHAVYGYLGLLLVTLISLRHTDEHRHKVASANDVPTTTAAKPSHDCAELCAPMFRMPAVREAIRNAYEPDAWIPGQEQGAIQLDPQCHSEWRRIDFETIQFHRHGTTSFILAGIPTEASQGYRRPLALKCIIYPYLRTPTIVRATNEYMSRYGVPSRDVEHIARVWASSPSWIIMDFIAGQTLGERVRRELAATTAPRRGVELDVLADYGRRLFDAMADLERAGLRHGDLSPSNIMVRDDGRFVLIDFGVNYLYTHTMPGLEGPDATFVAPEIRAGEGVEDRADLYSIGRLLIAFAGGSPGSGGPVPDIFYAETPMMARFIEDLIDSQPTNRLLIFTPDSTKPIYPQLRINFDEELAAMVTVRAGRGGYRGNRFVRDLIDLVRPLAGAPRQQLRLWQLRRHQQLYRDPRRGMHVRWLLFWSLVSATVWYVGAIIVVTWSLRDLQLDWGNQLLSLLQRAAGSPSDEFPYLDELRASDYPIPDYANLPVRMVGMSFLLVGARYYQNLFAGLTPLIAGFSQGRLSVLAIVAEIHMRSQTVAAFVLVMQPTLIQRRWWPIVTAIGILACFLTNWSCLSFARAALARAREYGISTAPIQASTPLKSFSDWTPSSGFYAAACWVIGLLIYFGLANDIFMYAGAVSAINVVLFYTIKCSGQSAADVRAGLGRAFLAAERTRYLSAGDQPGNSGAPACR